jgi:formamidopyrimidine-DNA glycosylase
MPELPEVESARFTVHESCAGFRVVGVDTVERGGGPREGLFDDIVHDVREGETQASFVDALLDRQLVACKRKGKQIWLELGPVNGVAGAVPEISVLIHLGMTGAILLKGGAIPTYKVFKVDDTKFPPKFSKLHLTFDNGAEIAFCDPRRIGRVRIRRVADASLVDPVRKLAPDPILDGIDSAHFVLRLSALSTSIKGALLDQESLVCGIGNWLADEVLYAAGIHPATPCKAIDDNHAMLLASKIEEICRNACGCTCRNMDLPKHFLFHFRWGKGGQHQTDFHGNRIVFEKVAGRTSAVVPVVQHKVGTVQKTDKETTAGPTESKYFAKMKDTEARAAQGKGGKRVAVRVDSGPAGRAVKKARARTP